MSLDLRSNRVVHQAMLALACSVCFACGDDTESSTPGVRAATRDAAADASEAGKGGNGGGGGSSSDDGRQKVTISFRAAVADRDFSCLERYDDVGSTKTGVRPVDFRFYVQDLALIDADGEEVPVELDARAPWQTKDVALIDFEDMQGSCKGTPETNTTITGTVPAGDYHGVVFTNGVPEALNHLDQSTQPPPLDVTELYWAWLS
ncbi:MAG TPA: MbnP family copper-binding protein, partial [Polyangiales bacterium]|nr:MbnP family copper-binding protein [Polyangiales bacterium]